MRTFYIDFFSSLPFATLTVWSEFRHLETSTSLHYVVFQASLNCISNLFTPTAELLGGQTTNSFVLLAGGIGNVKICLERSRQLANLDWLIEYSYA